MEATETPASPASDAEESPQAAPEESASQPEAAPDDISPASRAQMNDLIRGLVGQPRPGSASKPGADTDDDEPADDPDGDPTPADGAAEPSEQQGRPPGRRKAAAEITRLNGEVERLSKLVEGLSPKPPPDASEAERQAAVDREERYRRLLVKPDSDPDWTSEDWDFLQKEKAERASNPKWEQHYRTVTADLEQRWQGWAEQTIAARWNAVQADLSSTLTLPGVTDEVKARLLKAPLSEQIETHRRLEREILEPELKRLRDENAELRRDLLGSTRAPLNGGRSSPGRAVSESDLMNTLIRGRRRAG